MWVTGALLWAFVAAVTLAGHGAAEGQGATSMARRTIEEALKDLTDRLMSIPGVEGTAEGRCEGQACIKVFVAKKTPALLRKIPAAVDGYPVAVEQTDEFRALDR